MDLVERGPQLAALADRLGDVRCGAGAVVLVAGEAGAGKSALVSAFLDAVTVRVVAGSCDSMAAPKPLGPLIDIAAQLGVDVSLSRDGLFAGVLAELAHAPTVMLVEDVHWADDATADFLLYAGRRLDRVPALILATYRDDEVGPRPAVARLLGEMTRLSITSRLPVEPLSERGVRALVADSALDAADVHRLTAGNAFFVTELLAAGHTRPVSVRDAVLARMGALSPRGRRIIEIASQLGLRCDAAMLAELGGEDAPGVDDCVESGVLSRFGDELGFRHELARVTVADEILPVRLAALNRAILRALERRRDVDVTRLAAHAAIAHEADAAYRYGLAAGRQAAEVGAHRQAVHHYRTALSFASERDARDRAALLDILAGECIVIDQMDEALAAGEQALQIWTGLDDRLRLGATTYALSNISWYLGQGQQSRALSQQAVTLLEPLGDSAELARALASEAANLVDDRDFGGAVALSDRALAMARQQDDRYAEADLLITLGSMRAGEQDIDRAAEQLTVGLQIAQAAGLGNLAGRAYANLAELFAEYNMFDRCDRIVAEGLQYTDDHDLYMRFVCLTGMLAETELHRGRWDDAVTDAEGVLARTGTMSVGKIPSLTTIGLVEARRGEPAADPHLLEALQLARQTTDNYRITPAVLALTELSWLAGSDDQARAWLAQATDPSGSPPTASNEGRIRSWASRLGVPATADPSVTPSPYVFEIAGRWPEAADAWQALDRPYDQALALLEVATPTALTEAFEILDRLGARPAAALAAAKLRLLGERVPRGMRSTTRTNPAGLTTRELEVLSHIATGRTNAEIAAELFISDKTVEHHVSRVLDKLGVVSRRDAARAATELDIPVG